MSFTKNSRSITCRFHHISKRSFISVKNGNTTHRIMNSIPQRIPSGQKGTPTGRTKWRRVEISKIYPGPGKPVDAWSLNHRMSVPAKFVVSMIVDQHDYHIGFDCGMRC